MENNIDPAAGFAAIFKLNKENKLMFWENAIFMRHLFKKFVCEHFWIKCFISKQKWMTNSDYKSAEMYELKKYLNRQ